MKKIAVKRQLRAMYKSENCILCGSKLKPKITDETVYNPNRRSPVYWHDRENWFPHYDVEYGCENCGHYEHYTHNADGSIKVMSVDRVVFDVENRWFSIIDEGGIRLARELPPNVEPFSRAFYKYLDEVLKDAYHRGSR